MASLDLYLIKPTRYDDDGYPVQWWRSLIPSNSLAAVAGLVRDALDRGALKDLGEVRVTNADEVNTKVDISRIIAEASGRKTLVFLIGVQTNQFPRAMDMARPLRAAGAPKNRGLRGFFRPISDQADPLRRRRLSRAMVALAGPFEFARRRGGLGARCARSRRS